MHPGHIFGAGFYAAVGTAALIRPGLIPATFGGRAATASSRTEVRAVYGGLPLAMAGLVVAASKSPALGQGLGTTKTVAVLSAAMAIGRVIGAVIEGEADGVTRAFVAVEAGTAVALILGGRAE